MATIKQFFRNLNKKISNAKTRRALMFLNRRARRFVNSLQDRMDKKIASVELQKSIKLIQKKRLELKR